MSRPGPEVSVIVIVFNDAPRLPRAVASALAQTHPGVEILVVDDCSTDGTAEVADAIAAAYPDRVRAIHLPANSGGCSRPRNVGVEQARGDYVMFLDSDDELDPDACRVLSEAASQEDADFSSGLTVRVLLSENGRSKPWKPGLYAQRAVVDGIEALPEMLNDSLSTNKCWKREFLLSHGLTFPEGIHFEDLVFTAEAYLAARRFVLVPQRVYTWYVEDGVARTSITNQRAELANLEDRLEAHRRIDALLLARGLRDLKLAKDVKLIRHDVRLYVNDFLHRDASWQQAVLDVLGAYLPTLEPAAAADAGKLHEIEIFYLEQRDVPGLLSTVRYIRHGGKISQPLVRRDGRIYWGSRYLDTDRGCAVLDVTELGLEQLPHAEFPFFHLLTRLSAEPHGLQLEGASLNQLGRLDGADLALRISPRKGRGTTCLVPVTAVVSDGEVLRWGALLDLAAQFRPLGVFDELYDVSVQAQVGSQVNVSPLTLDPEVGDRPDLPVRPRLTRLAASHARPYVTRQGNLALRLVALTPASQAARRLVSTLRPRRVSSR